MMFSWAKLSMLMLHYGLGSAVFDVEVCNGIDKVLVEMRGPHKAGPFLGMRWLLADGAVVDLARLLCVVVVVGFGGGVGGARVCRA